MEKIGETENFSSTYQADRIDLELLALLRKDAKMSSKELAAAVGLSLTPTYERVKRLERNAYIMGYQAKISKEKTRKALRVLCNVSVKTHAVSYLKAFEEEVIKLSEVVSCYHIAGNFDYLLLIEVFDMNTYSHFIKEKLASIPHIANVQSSFIMSVLKED